MAFIVVPHFFYILRLLKLYYCSSISISLMKLTSFNKPSYFAYTIRNLF